MPNRMIRWFAFGHLPEHLQEVSAPCTDLAEWMDKILPEGAEKTAGLRKLLEAKDCFVRAKLESEDPSLHCQRPAKGYLPALRKAGIRKDYIR